MYYLSLDVRQDDCPLTRVTCDYSTTLTTPYWRFDRRSGRWELRIHADAPSAEELGAGLRALRDTDSVQEFELHRKSNTTAFVRTTLAETTAIDTISCHGGYIVGPFSNKSGIERWHLGFNTEAAADAALSDLDRHETFTVRDRFRVTDGFGHEQHPFAGGSEKRFQLTDREREILETALERGYYDTPRTITAAALGDEFGISDVAISKMLRRAERKLVSNECTDLAHTDPSSE